MSTATKRTENAVLVAQGAIADTVVPFRSAKFPYCLEIGNFVPSKCGACTNFYCIINAVHKHNAAAAYPLCPLNKGIRSLRAFLAEDLVGKGECRYK